MSPKVMEIVAIEAHPNADRLDVLTVSDGQASIALVTGKHYRLGDLGLWLPPGLTIPGVLAYELWLVGKKRATEEFEVREIEIRGTPSPGLWCGRWYRNDNSTESKLRADDLQRGGGRVVDGWIEWHRWRESWRAGDDVELGQLA